MTVALRRPVAPDGIAAASGAMAALLIVSGCVPPETRFFADRPISHVQVARVADTVLLRRLTPSDSLSPDGMRTALRIRDRAIATGRTDLSGVMAEITLGMGTAVPKVPGSVADSIFARLQRRPLNQRLDLLRADLISFTAARIDTVIRAVPADSSGAVQQVAEEWVALILAGSASTDPTVGRRLTAKAR